MVPLSPYSLTSSCIFGLAFVIAMLLFEGNIW